MQYDRQIKGTIPSGTGIFEIKGSMPDPPLIAAILLQEALASVGIMAIGAFGSLKDVMPVGNRNVIYTLSLIHI